jgi:hypothetical protein
MPRLSHLGSVITSQPNLGEEGERAEEGGPEVGPPRLRRARPDGGAVGDDPEGEVDGDAAAVEVPHILVPRVGLQEVPEASPHAHLSLSHRRRVRRWRRVSNGTCYAGAPVVGSGLPRALSWVGFPVSARAHECISSLLFLTFFLFPLCFK